MTLVTAHKILIAAAILLFAFFAVHRFLAFANGSENALIAGLFSTGAAAGLVAYSRTLLKSRE